MDISAKRGGMQLRDAEIADTPLMRRVCRIEIVVSHSGEPAAVQGWDTVVLDYHLVAVLDDGQRVVDASYGGIQTSTLFASVAISLDDIDELLNAGLDHGIDSFEALLRALAASGTATTVDDLRAAPRTLDASQPLREELKARASRHQATEPEWLLRFYRDQPA